MNTRILLLAISVAAFSSCSVYKNGQTPDDMYYSPAPAARLQANNNTDNDNGDSYVNVNQPKQGSNFQSYDEYQDSYRDDRFLRMSVGNPYYMDSYNSYGAFDWRYNSFYNGFNYGFSSPWNNYFAWNSFYNPYAPGLYYGYGSGFYGGGYYSGGGGYYGGGVKSVAYTTPISRPVTFNVNNYANGTRPNTGRNYLNTNNYNNANGRYNNNNGNNNRNNNSYYNNNNNARSTYTPATNTNSNSNSNSAPSRSYSPSSSSGGGGGSVSRPSRN